MPSKTGREEGENYFATREEGKTSEREIESSAVQHWRPVRAIRQIQASTNGRFRKREINIASVEESEEERRLKRETEGGRRKRKTRRYAQKRDLSIVRSSVDDPTSDSRHRQFLQDHFEGEGLSRAARTIIFYEERKNYP